MTRNPDQYTFDFTSAANERCALLTGLREACLPIDRSAQQLALIMYFVNPRQHNRQLDRAEALEEFERKPPEIQAQLEFLPPGQAQGRLGVSRQ